MKLIALENCTACQGTPAGLDQSSSGNTNQNEPTGDKFTYDKGEGVKDKIVISGPLSKAIREAMGQIFVKKNVMFSDDPGNVDEALDTASEQKSVATESQAQDAYIAGVIKAAEENPGLDVVLHDFDFVAQDEHVRAVENGTAIPQTQRDPAIIPMFVARAEDLMRPDVFDQLAAAEDLNVVVVSGVDTSSGSGDITDVNYLATAGGITRALHSQQDHVISDKQVTSSLVKAAALERAYEGMKIRLFFGTESFMAELAQYHKSKKAKTA